MNRKEFRLLLMFLFLFPIACEKEKPEVANLSTKIELGNNIVESIAYRNALITGEIGATYRQTVKNYGHCWDTIKEPTISKNRTSFGTYSGSVIKSFTSSLEGLVPKKEYFVRSYFVLSDIVVYGIEKEFTTKGGIELSTATVTNITTNSATSGGNITDDGSSPITARGICWSASPNPTISDSKTSDGSGTGSFISQITGLTENTTYYVRAYATNEIGTGYGNEISFTTKDGICQLSTTTVSIITINSATSGGNITDDGGSPITARGVCWSTSQNPTTSYNKTIDGSGTGSFTSNLTGLQSSTTYYIRAYATNAITTSYGNQVSFFIGVQDTDGNTYSTITIGKQVWMKENLKTTKYNDGTPIPNVTGNSQWSSLTTGAFCWYSNSISNKETYGALYNWYAVNTGKLCPVGWHVPSDAEWTTLENYLIANGFNYDGTTTGNKIAKALAATTNWLSSTTTGAVGNTDYPAKRNATGFSALPGGYRGNNNGTFDNAGGYGVWWSSAEYSSSDAWYRGLNYSVVYVYRYVSNKEGGFSVRCLRDN